MSNSVHPDRRYYAGNEPGFGDVDIRTSAAVFQTSQNNPYYNSHAHVSHAQPSGYFDVEEPVPGSYSGRQFDSKRKISAFELREFGKFTPRAQDSDSMGSKVKDYARKFSAEFLGTFMLVLIGDGSIAQLVMKRSGASPEGSDFLNVALGYGLGLMVGILVSGGVSGGHLNPAVTLSMCCLKKCKWICLPIYWAAQYLGALLAAAILYGIYADGINSRLDGPNLASAGIFASYPADKISTVTLVFDQCLGTAVLLIIILAVTDGKNMKVASGLVPLLIGLGLAVIHISFAFNAGCAINPARDFSPRLLTLMAGFGGETFTAADSFFWIPWIMPHIGGVLGALSYFFLIEWHHPDTEDM